MTSEAVSYLALFLAALAAVAFLWVERKKLDREEREAMRRFNEELLRRMRGGKGPE